MPKTNEKINEKEMKKPNFMNEDMTVINRLSQIPQSKTQVSANNVSGNFGYISNKQPYVKLKIPIWSKPNNYWEVEGVPINANLKIKDCSGLIIVSDVHIDNVGQATNEEKDEIERLLKKGIIV